jgi:hypothetical protein
MPLAAAIAAAGRLRDLLSAEVEGARGERRLLRTLDSAALFARAQSRAAFLAETQRVERELADGLVVAARALGIQEVTLQRLEAAAPRDGGALARALSEVRALAGALQEIDALNRSLAERALSCVRGYVDAVAPAPQAYDRRGARPAPAAAARPALAVVSSRG